MYNAINPTSITSLQRWVYSKPWATEYSPTCLYSFNTTNPSIIEQDRRAIWVLQVCWVKKKYTHVIWDCISWYPGDKWRKQSKWFFNTSNLSFCYRKKLLSVAIFCSAGITCLYYSSKIIIIKAVMVLWFLFMVQSYEY